MMNYKKLNIVIGWLVFIVASAVYLMTIEPTASFWDCGEFISSAYKMEVGHPPGAPFFMLMGKFFTLFAGNNPERVPVMINALSALASSFTILFLFWTITHLAKKIVISVSDNNANELTISNKIAIFGSGIVGALAYTFSDTFWFSAVEGEVYAFSSFFTAIVFWAILKWENIANEKYSNRWLILIAYLMGISIGVHLLNLLAIPAIVFVYYFRKHKVTRAGLLGATTIAVILLGGIMYVIIPGVVKLASLFELIFVNTFKTPFNTGLYFYLVVLAVGLGLGIYLSHQRGKVILNTILVGITVIIIGYSSYAVIFIRSTANPPMDQNNPENLYSMLYYLNREQYGDRPLFKGEFYNAPVKKTIETKPIYITGKDYKGRDKYVVNYKKMDYVFDELFVTIFPRMYSRQPRHIEAYKRWGKINGTPIRATNYMGQPEMIYRPTFGENLRFFFRYQIGHMYLRYFMWNFAGRQNDVQGHGNILNGNWICGIRFIDEARLGPQDNLPDFLKNNKARNKYFMLPLLLGLIGLLYQLNKGKKDFTVVFLLFIFTGVAIVVYLNQYPFQPRERDYAYAGSFYAFSIWIGLGVLALINLFSKKITNSIGGILVSLCCLLLVPTIMAKENWDDHNRSRRYTARDFARNYLNSCAPNAILFTNGDNDTFPLWYVQEVEEIRTDVRVINLSYLGADWYIEQMYRKVYDSDPVPFSMEPKHYQQGSRDVVYIVERIKGTVDLKQAIDFVKSDDPQTKTLPQSREPIDHFPAKNFGIKVDSAMVIANGTVPIYKKEMIKPYMEFNINKSRVLKNELMVLDLLANNNWERPIYYAVTVTDDLYLNLTNYFQIEGMAYRIVPVKHENTSPFTGGIAPDIMYDNMMNKFEWGGINDTTVYLDENNLRMASNFRSNFARLAEALIKENKEDSALAVMEKCLEITPHNTIPYDFYMIPIVELYFELGKEQKAMEIVSILSDIYLRESTYYASVIEKHKKSIERPNQIAMYVIQQIARLYSLYGKEEELKDLEMKFQSIQQPGLYQNL